MKNGKADARPAFSGPAVLLCGYYSSRVGTLHQKVFQVSFLEYVQYHYRYGVFHAKGESCRVHHLELPAKRLQRDTLRKIPLSAARRRNAL